MSVAILAHQAIFVLQGVKYFPETTAFERHSVERANIHNQHWLTFAHSAHYQELKNVCLVQRCSKCYQLMQLACVREG